MLTVVVSTPRTGSDTYLQSLESKWWPDSHPEQQPCTEFFNSSGWSVSDKLITRNHLFEELKEFVERDPDVPVAIKLNPGCLPYYMVCELLDASTQVYYTVRRNYQDQLMSYVAAEISQNGGARPEETYIDVDQDFVERMHKRLTTHIKNQYKLYQRFSGELVILENRDQARAYGPKPIFEESIIWPMFNTLSLFSPT